MVRVIMSDVFVNCRNPNARMHMHRGKRAK